jgi:hypothetical protein
MRRLELKKLVIFEQLEVFPLSRRWNPGGSQEAGPWFMRGAKCEVREAGRVGCLNFLPGLRWCASSGSDLAWAILIENNSPDEDEQEHDRDPEPRCCKDRESCATARAKRAAWRADRFTVSANHRRRSRSLHIS